MNKETFILTTIKGNGKFLKPVIRHTEKGVSDYANSMFRKYGESVTVEVDKLQANGYIKPYTVYHA